MANESDAENAIASLHGHILNGSEINVERSTKSTQGRGTRGVGTRGSRGGGPSRGGGGGGVPRRNTIKIFVGNLRSGVTNDDLRTLFEPFGTVAEADVCGGFGFVHMTRESDALEAMNSLNGYNLKGGHINIELSTKETQGRSSDFVGSNPSASQSSNTNGFRSSASQRSSGLSRVPRPTVGTPGIKSNVPAPRGVITPSLRPDVSSQPAPGPTSQPASQQQSAPVSTVTFDTYGYEVRSPPHPIGLNGSHSVAATVTGVNDAFARDLLTLYNKDPGAFDRYAKDPIVRKSLEIQSMMPVTVVTGPANEHQYYAAAAAHGQTRDYYSQDGYESTAALMPPASHLLGGIGYQSYAATPVHGSISYASQLPAWGGLPTGPHHVYTMFE